MNISATVAIALLASTIACVAPENAPEDVFRVSQSVTIANGHAIEGYADKLSAVTGETLRFSVHSPVSAYSVTINRYGSDAGPQIVAGPFQCTNGAVRDYTDTAYKDGAGWPISLALTVPASNGTLSLANCSGSFSVSKWASGIYVARLQATNNPSFDITFVVKDAPNDQKSILLLASTNTWQAYNFWPDHFSFYDCATGGLGVPDVNFRRPNPYATAEVHDNGNTGCDSRPFYRTEHLVAGEVRLARWFERNARPYSMVTDADVHSGWNETTKATAFDSFNTVVISTHNEYWSDSMYKSFAAFLSRGGNVVSISGNTAYRRVTIDASNKMTNTDAKWDSFTQSPDPSWTDFIQKKRLFGFRFPGGSTSICLPFRPTTSARSAANKLGHWSFESIPDGSPLGSTGEIASPSSRCTLGSGASGEETDVAIPAFAREFIVLGDRTDGYESSIVHLRGASAGQVFTIGSITAGGSFAIGDTNLTRLLQNVLNRTNQRAFSDFSGDGYTDLVGLSASDGNLWLMKGTTEAGVQFPRTSFDAGWSLYNKIISPGDFDSDGAPDLLARRLDGQIIFYRGTGTGTLKTTPEVAVASGWDVYTDLITPGDFDGDGRPDVLGWKTDGTIWLHRANGTGGFATPAMLIDSGWNVFVEIMSPGDFDEDGHPDLIARKTDGTLWFYRGTGNGTIDQAAPAQLGTGWNSYNRLIAGGDFDRDGHADVLALLPGGTMHLYKGAGNGTFVPVAGSQIGATGAFSQFNGLFSIW